MRIRCDYSNTEPRTVWQGPRSTDEMCMFIGSYYPAKPHTSLCSSDPDAPNETQSMGADWVGQGSGTCAEALGCVDAIGEAEDFIQEVTNCVLATAPSESQVLSAALRCLLTSEDPGAACTEQFGACMGGG